MNRALALLSMLSFVGAEPIYAAETVCGVIKHFEDAPKATNEAQRRRWIEFHWGFDHAPDALWSWGCRHSDQTSATQTCTWLKSHTNQEFAMMLPQNIMACYGYRFPPHASYDWQRIAGTIRLHGGEGRSLLLDLSYRDLPKGEVAMRLAVEFDGVEYEPDEMPDIMPMPLSPEVGNGSRAANP